MTLRHRTASADVEENILEAAALLLEHEGPGALSIRHLCATAEVAPMSVYNHFSSKSGVVDALCRRGFDRLYDALETAHRLSDDEAALRAGLVIYRALALDRPATYQLMLMRSIPGHEPSERAMTSAEQAFAQLVRAVQRMMDSGRFAQGDPREIAQRIWAACHGWISLELFNIGFSDDASVGYDGLVDLLIAGLHPTR